MSERFVYTTPLDPLARPLVEELSYEYESRYGDFYEREGGPREMEKYPAELFSPPEGGNFVLLVRNGEAIGGGAFKRHPDPGTAELKRVWAHSALRRQGLARRVVQELEAQALRQGYTRIFLNTGFRQPEAVALYLGQGYSALFDRTAPEGTYRSLPFEKILVQAPALARAA